VEEQTWRDTYKKPHRPLPERLEVRNRQKSLRLQRLLTDFGADDSFENAARKMKEHHGLEMGASAVRETTLHHAEKISEKLEALWSEPFRALPAHGAKQLITEADGSFLRIVPSNLPRKGKRPRDWTEVRVVAAQKKGAARAVFSATFGPVEQAGRCWAMVARLAGWALDTQVHGLGDGAEWICRQLREIFGAEARYLIDFYHLMDYLAAAAGSICRGKEKCWLRTQKRRLKKGQWKKVCAELQKHLEPEHRTDEEAPVRRAWRYMSNRPTSFDYHIALAEELPIGSGMIESSHGHLLQKRLKQNGMAWIIENAEIMAHLRVDRANEGWEQYWENARAA
jgi:hypothetical protein